jgi:hypothetical protein
MPGHEVLMYCSSNGIEVRYGVVCSQGHEIHHNVTAGVILSDHSLVLQGVTRHTAGDYTCLAANTEGKGTSNPVTLRVMCEYKPLCPHMSRDALWRPQ